MDQQSILAKHTRQPKIYIKLPSNGVFYKVNPLEKSGSGELPIYSMTAKDEIAIKTPDALMNGEATAGIIKSCCPLINDPWEIPAIDLDAILIAIRIATYGEKMTSTVRVPMPDNKYEELETEIDLRPLLDGTLGKEFPSTVKYNDLTFHVKPLTYKDQSKFFEATFETQRMASLINDSSLSDEQKRKAFVEGFKKLSSTQMGVVLQQITAIETDEGSETDPKNIEAFFNETDKDTFAYVSKFLQDTKELFDIPAQIVQVPQNLQEQGAPKTVTVPMMFDTANFFASR